MGKKAPKVVEGRSQQQRKAVRQKLGKLKDLTVQPRTRQRYEASLQQFFSWLEREGLVLPKRVAQMDNLVSDYLEYLWADGHGKSEANNALAALQDFDPNLRRKLPGSWRLLKAWSTAEIPVRAPPMTIGLLDALCGWAVMQGLPDFALSLRVAFFGLLRTGELLSLTSKDVYISGPKGPAVISLGLTKSGARQGASESVTIVDTSVLPSLYSWKRRNSANSYLTSKPHAWRKTFNQAIAGLQLTALGLRPYSLRRGGATFFFQHHGSFDKLLLQGRWAAAKTARIYLNEGLAQLSEMQVPNSRLRTYACFYLQNPILEPGPRKAPRSGGRGRASKRVFFLHEWGSGNVPQKETS